MNEKQQLHDSHEEAAKKPTSEEVEVAEETSVDLMAFRTGVEQKVTARLPGHLAVRVPVLIGISVVLMSWLQRQLQWPIESVLASATAVVTGYSFVLPLAQRFFSRHREVIERGLADVILQYLGFLLKTPVLATLVLITLIPSLFYSSVTVAAVGVSGPRNVELYVQDSDLVATRGRKPYKSGRLASENEVLTFNVTTTPFGRPLLLKVSGFQHEAVNVLPGIGATIDLTRLAPSPAIMLRRAPGSLSLKGTGQIKLFLRGEDGSLERLIGVAEVQEGFGSLVFGWFEGISDELRAGWERDLTYLAALEESERQGLALEREMIALERKREALERKGETIGDAMPDPAAALEDELQELDDELQELDERSEVQLIESEMAKDRYRWGRYVSASFLRGGDPLPDQSLEAYSLAIPNLPYQLDGRVEMRIAANVKASTDAKQKPQDHMLFRVEVEDAEELVENDARVRSALMPAVILRLPHERLLAPDFDKEAGRIVLFQVDASGSRTVVGERETSSEFGSYVFGVAGHARQFDDRWDDSLDDEVSTKKRKKIHQAWERAAPPSDYLSAAVVRCEVCGGGGPPVTMACDECGGIASDVFRGVDEMKRARFEAFYVAGGPERLGAEKEPWIATATIDDVISAPLHDRELRPVSRAKGAVLSDEELRAVRRLPHGGEGR